MAVGFQQKKHNNYCYSICTICSLIFFKFSNFCKPKLDFHFILFDQPSAHSKCQWSCIFFTGGWKSSERLILFAEYWNYYENWLHEITWLCHEPRVITVCFNHMENETKSFKNNKTLSKQITPTYFSQVWQPLLEEGKGKQTCESREKKRRSACPSSWNYCEHLCITTKFNWFRWFLNWFLLRLKRPLRFLQFLWKGNRSLGRSW